MFDQFRAFGIPVQPGGRTGLFDQPEAVAEPAEVAAPVQEQTA